MKVKEYTNNVKYSLPFNKKKEISGFITKKEIHYTMGNKTSCPAFLDEKFVFHTHLDIATTDYRIAYPDLPSPQDIIAFMFSENNRMIIKTNRIFMDMKKTKYFFKIIRPMIFGYLEKYTNNIQKYIKEKNYCKALMAILTIVTTKKSWGKTTLDWNIDWVHYCNAFGIDVKINEAERWNRI